MTSSTSLTYRDAGVDIDAGDALVERERAAVGAECAVKLAPGAVQVAQAPPRQPLPGGAQPEVSSGWNRWIWRLV